MAVRSRKQNQGQYNRNRGYILGAGAGLLDHLFYLLLRVGEKGFTRHDPGVVEEKSHLRLNMNHTEEKTKEKTTII